MEMTPVVTLSTRKSWVSPELKKVDVETVTAAGNTGATDNVLSGNS